MANQVWDSAEQYIKIYTLSCTLNIEMICTEYNWLQIKSLMEIWGTHKCL